ncbi:MAG: bioD [Rickettsiaceae bacterium]|jgi:dethiobiotin synthetase|nr:bioD [Rickettsiaceae bacterium]
MTKSYFITATGTGIGKTYITCALINKLQHAGKTVRAIKPVISGWENSNTDTHRILEALNVEATDESIAKTSPWRFDQPLSPDIATRLVGKSIDFEELVNFCHPAGKEDYLLIEGVGGVMVPLNSKKTIADLIKKLQIPVILVAGSYLGSISHTLTAITTLKSYDIIINRIIISQSKDCAGKNEMIETLQNFTNIPIILVPYGASTIDGNF